MAERMTPLYKNLPVFEKTGYRHAWGVFGEGDELGTIARLTPERIARAAGTVRRGAVFNLSLPLNEPNPPIVERRKPYRHEIVEPERNSRDDKIDDLWNQASSQIDALSHMRYREFGFYNGLEKDAVDAGALGIDRWADHGIVGRGLLLDMPRYFASRGEPFDPSRDTAWKPDVLEAALAAQGVEPEEGDMLLLRTGWMTHYFSLSAEQRAALPQHLGPGGLESPGLSAVEESAAFLWDAGFSLVAADNPAVEDSPGSPEAGFLHRRLIPLLGMALGELWTFETLADDCARDGVYECMVVAVPLNLPRGVGSPANAIAIK